MSKNNIFVFMKYNIAKYGLKTTQNSHNIQIKQHPFSCTLLFIALEDFQI